MDLQTTLFRDIENKLQEIETNKKKTERDLLETGTSNPM